MGSGGSHALWPVTNHTTKGLFFKRFGGTYILELDDPDELMRIIIAVDFCPSLDEFLCGPEPLFLDIFWSDLAQILLEDVYYMYFIWEDCLVVFS